MSGVRTKGTRSNDAAEAALEEHGFGVLQLQEFVREGHQGPQPWDLKGILRRIPNGALVAALLGAGSLLLSSSYVIIHLWSNRDDRQDAAIAENRSRTETLVENQNNMSTRLNYFIVVAERADKRLDDMREEALREYRAQARDRGDADGVKRLTAKLKTIEQQRAAQAPPPGGGG